MPNQEETNETEWEARERAGEIPFNQEGKESMEKRLNEFLNSRCFQIDTDEEREQMKKIYPTHEGTWRVHKDSLRQFVESEINQAENERDEYWNQTYFQKAYEVLTELDRKSVV